MRTRKHMANYGGVKLYEVMQITAETMQTYKIWHITMLTAQLT